MKKQADFFYNKRILFEKVNERASVCAYGLIGVLASKNNKELYGQITKAIRKSVLKGVRGGVNEKHKKYKRVLIFLFQFTKKETQKMRKKREILYPIFGLIKSTLSTPLYYILLQCLNA